MWVIIRGGLTLEKALLLILRVLDLVSLTYDYNNNNGGMICQPSRGASGSSPHYGRGNFEGGRYL
jgi:hypothetical protein